MHGRFVRTPLAVLVHVSMELAGVAHVSAYREYPLDWVVRQMKKVGMEVISARRMAVLYAPHTVKRQVP